MNGYIMLFYYVAITWWSDEHDNEKRHHNCGTGGQQFRSTIHIIKMPTWTFLKMVILRKWNPDCLAVILTPSYKMCVCVCTDTNI